jgi:hypothetical protein
LDFIAKARTEVTTNRQTNWGVKLFQGTKMYSTMHNYALAIKGEIGFFCLKFIPQILTLFFFQVNGNWYIAFFLITPFITKTFYPKKCATDLYSSDSINGKYVCFHSKMLGLRPSVSEEDELMELS